ncbi:MAG: class I tRNA ligase family protein, partial [Gammaproteobacteria bacterium]|nr:class I tRNA ligase family protein [Gammaproteobacteria bacterium]
FRRLSPTYLAEDVSDTEGTGIVHSSPAYGLEDFYSCVRNGMPIEQILSPVQNNGIYKGGPFDGWHLWKVNQRVIDVLDSSLFSVSKIQHSYPHCWRHKSPVIYRLAAQWFIRMDEGVGIFATDPSPLTLRQLALKAIDDTEFYPQSGRNRLRDMIANRPDWCISRQRSWGVPIPFLLHKETGDLHPRTLELIDKIADIIFQGGIEAWTQTPVSELLTQDSDDSYNYIKSQDILEVWVDSGTSFWHVLRGSHEQVYTGRLSYHPVGPEADMYLEGHDQHRGWFHSSLLLGCAIYGRAPYKSLLTHGFATDGQGRKMSKSLGNVVSPMEVVKEFGAEILRLWVANTDYSGDLNVDKKILARVVDAYRRLRNTFRFLLANINDFDYEQDFVIPEELLELDRYALCRLAQIQGDLIGQYDAQLGFFVGGYYGQYEFHPVVTHTVLYCTEELGGFYLDVLKDRLYTTPPKSKARRSAQSVLYHILHSLVLWMSPILSFTAEEIWQVLGYKQSIFIEKYWLHTAIDEKLMQKWQNILMVRRKVNEELEKLRAQGKIGSGLQAKVRVWAQGAIAADLASLGEELHFVFITSQADLLEVEAFTSNQLVLKVKNGSFALEVSVADGVKCSRCWHYVDQLVPHGHPPDQEVALICQRCDLNLNTTGENRQWV